MDSPTLDTFPTDLLAKIAKSLPPRSICHLAAVCRATSAATTGPPSVWELLLALQLRAAAAAVAAAAREAAAPTGVAPVAAAAGRSGLPIGRNADGATCAVVVFIAGGGGPPHAAAMQACAWPPPPAGPRGPAVPAWLVALPIATEAVSWAHPSEYWAVLPGGGPAGRDALALRRVWWFDVTASVEAALPGGDYEVALNMVRPARRRARPGCRHGGRAGGGAAAAAAFAFHAQRGRGGRAAAAAAAAAARCRLRRWASLAQ